MAQPLTITIAQDPDYQVGDFMQLEVASVLQPDRIVVNPIEGTTGVYGSGIYGDGLYGFAVGQPYGDGVYGEGYYGVGAAAFVFNSLNQFVANDYVIQMRGVDSIGNVGTWSNAFTHHHRPAPPAPANLSCTANILTWTWSDP